MADFDDEELDLDTLDPEGADDEEEPEDPKVLRERLRAERAAREAAETSAARERERADEWLRGAHSREANPRQTQKPLGPMPDPVTDREGFARWQAEKDARAQAELDARLEARERAEEEQRAATNERVQLWDRFREKYPALASREALAGAAYRELHASGRLPRGQEAIVDAVRAEMTRLAGGKTASRAAGTTPERSAPRAARKPGSEAVVPSMADTILKRKQELGLI